MLINFSSDKPREENAYLKNLHDINEGLFHVSVDETLVSGSFDLGIIEVDYDSYVIYQGCDYKYEIGKKIKKLQQSKWKLY